jgi:cystathionine beta-synthase
MRASTTLGLIGNTPLVEVTCFDTGVCRLFLKLESQNPGGSIKDRVGLSMVEVAEREGKIRPGDRIVEATAGNTGLGLALAAAQKGYKLTLVIPDKMSAEKIHHLRAMGVEIVMTRSDVGKGHPEYYQDLAKRIASETPGSYYVDQFNNPANPLAHETTTGPEIWQQTSHEVDAIAVGVGSSGTLTGLTRFFKRVKPEVEFILADPSGSILADVVNKGTHDPAGSWAVEGIGEDFVPGMADFSLVRRAYSVPDALSFDTVRTLLRKEGIIAGSSSGTLIAAALRYAREQKEAKNVVTFVCDSGNKYLSKMYNDYWMRDHGYVSAPPSGDLRDLVSRTHSDRSVVAVTREDTLMTAFSRMQLHDVSQLPVLEGDRVVGLIDESDLLDGLSSGRDFEARVADIAVREPITVDVRAGKEEALALLRGGYTVLVTEGGRFYGLIAKIDYLNYLRSKSK